MSKPGQVARTITGIAKTLTTEQFEMTITQTHPDLDVDAFQVSLANQYEGAHYIGRSTDLARAIGYAVKQWRTGQPGVWDDDDDDKDPTKAGKYTRAGQPPGMDDRKGQP